MNSMKRNVILLNIVAIVVLIAALLWINSTYLDISAQQLREWMLTFGWGAPAVLLAVHAVRPFVLFSSSIVLIVGGLAYGVWWGSLLGWAGALLGIVLSFLVTRRLGRRITQKNWRGKMKTVAQQAEQYGFLYMLILRLIPVLNYEVVTYPAALSKMTFTAFWSASAIGIIPGVLIFTYMGAALASGEGDDIWLASISLVVVMIIPLVIYRILKRKHGWNGFSKH